MARRKTTEQFIADAVAVHGDKYGYDKVEYVTNRTKVTVTCPAHGDWVITPNNHLQGKGCPKCIGRNKTTEEIVKEFKTIHGDKYDYSKVIYVKNRTKVTITCPEHGDFEQTPHHHTKREQGCPECGRIKLEISRLGNAQYKKFKGLKQPEEYKLIPLTQGKFAMVDNEDFERLKGINWYYDGNYAKSNLEGYMHRFIMNAPPHLEVDHKEHDTLDNRKSNIRLATPTQNSANTRPKGGSSEYKGVSWNKRGSNWIVSIMYKGVDYNLGYFKDEKQAGMAYDLKCLEIRGDYGTLNFPELKEQYLKELEALTK